MKLKLFDNPYKETIDPLGKGIMLLYKFDNGYGAVVRRKNNQNVWNVWSVSWIEGTYTILKIQPVPKKKYEYAFKGCSKRKVEELLLHIKNLL